MNSNQHQTVRAFEDLGEGNFWASLSDAGFSPSERSLIESALERRNGRVLAIGCGAGRESLPLAKAGFATTGIDLSRLLLRKATSHSAGLPRLHYTMANAVALPFRDNSFDYVLMLAQMLGHIPGAKMRRRALREARRVLRPGGAILVSLYLGSLKDYPLSYLAWLAVARMWDKVRRSRVTQPSAGKDENLDFPRIERLSEVAATMLRARLTRLRLAARFLHKRGMNSSERRDVYVHPRLHRVSMKPTHGLAYYHIYARKEWIADLKDSGLVILKDYSIRELALGPRLPPFLRAIDQIHYFVLGPV